jgi:hypothetical protein
MTIADKSNVSTIASVAPSYAHYDKFIDPNDTLVLQGATLKWYNLAHRETPIPPEIHQLAHSFLTREAQSGLITDIGHLGFVILHRCNNNFYFLLLSTWRNENELWESVYAKDGEYQPDFQPFTFSSSHRGTYCVWELAAVWHEQQAWKRYLLSKRDEHARRTYLQDCYQGPA